MTNEIQLSPEQIVAAAVDILHEGGLDAVSMRSVAGRLGVTPPPVYARIGNKMHFWMRSPSTSSPTSHLMRSATNPGRITHDVGRSGCASASLRPPIAGSSCK